MNTAMLEKYPVGRHSSGFDLSLDLKRIAGSAMTTRNDGGQQFCSVPRKKTIYLKKWNIKDSDGVKEEAVIDLNNQKPSQPTKESPKRIMKDSSRLKLMLKTGELPTDIVEKIDMDRI